MFHGRDVCAHRAYLRAHGARPRVRDYHVHGARALYGHDVYLRAHDRVLRAPRFLDHEYSKQNPATSGSSGLILFLLVSLCP